MSTFAPAYISVMPHLATSIQIMPNLGRARQYGKHLGAGGNYLGTRSINFSPDINIIVNILNGGEPLVSSLIVSNPNKYVYTKYNLKKNI
jgi:hypothetical protein